MSFLSGITATFILHFKRILNFALRDAHEQLFATLEIVKISSHLSCYELLSDDAVRLIYKINDCIVLKYPAHSNNNDFKKKLTFFDIFEKHESCSDIVQSFLHVSESNFLVFINHDSLDQQLKAHQRQINDEKRSEKVTETESENLIK